ncbi:GntR family transcriptional regulator [Streptomyces sp. CMB-StM0423]|uniref:GntR family transcriptional regulator n=1 Tax=Streptomyces sp. CMB-StM0423 TaxID=2059884 RepID=UPI001F1A7D7D|nr:GntR family transcriptional regulator [Streptomyces sp. CMB-StM0423]
MPSAARLREQPAAGRPSPAGGGAGGHGTAAARRRRLRADRARQLADLLRGQVLGGAYAGGVLPHESVLGADYGATRNTVRQVLDLLRSERLVVRVPGLGTVVVAEKYAHGLDRLQGLAETLHEHGRVTNGIRTAGPVAAPACVAERLGAPEGGEVLYVERLRRLGGLPLSLDLTYLPMDIGVRLLGADLENTDRRDGRADAARADALRRGHVHPRLRRDGPARRAGPHRVPLGPVPPAHRPPGA